MNYLLAIAASLKKYTIVYLAMLNEGNLMVKLMLSTLLAISLSPIILFFEEILHIAFGSKYFLQMITFALFADLLSGIVKHFKNKTFDFKKLFTGFMTKVFVSELSMMLFNILSIINGGDTFTNWILFTGMLLSFVYVGGSAFLNLYDISGGKFPPVSFMNRFEKFNETLDVKDLMNKSTEEDKPE